MKKNILMILITLFFCPLPGQSIINNIELPKNFSEKNATPLIKDYKFWTATIVFQETPCFLNLSAKKNAGKQLEYLKNYYVYAEQDGHLLLGENNDQQQLEKLLGWVPSYYVLQGVAPLLLEQVKNQTQEIFLSSNTITKFTGNYLRVITLEKNLCFFDPILGKKVEKNFNDLIPFYFYYVYGIYNNQGKKYFLLSLNSYPLVEERCAYILGWIEESNVKIWPHQIAIEFNKKNFDDRKKQNKLIQIYRSYEDVECKINERSYKNDGTLIQSIASETDNVKSAWPLSWMRLPIVEIRSITTKKTNKKIDVAKIFFLSKRLEDSEIVLDNQTKLARLCNCDIAFVIDTTWSMKPYIRDVKSTLQNISKDVYNCFIQQKSLKLKEKINIQISVCLYRDEDHKRKGSYLTKFCPKVYSLNDENEKQELIEFIDSISADDNIGETWHEETFQGVLDAIDNKDFWREGSLRALVVFGDCGQHLKNADDKRKLILKKIRTKDSSCRISIYAVHTVTSGRKGDGKLSEEDFIKQMTSLAQETNGTFFEYQRYDLVHDAIINLLQQQQEKIKEQLNSLGKYFNKSQNLLRNEYSSEVLQSVRNRYEEIYKTPKERQELEKSLSEDIFVDEGWIILDENISVKYMINLEQTIKLVNNLNSLYQALSQYCLKRPDISSKEKMIEFFLYNLCTALGIEPKKEYIKLSLNEITGAGKYLPITMGYLKIPIQEFALKDKKQISQDIIPKLENTIKELYFLIQNKDAKGNPHYNWVSVFGQHFYTWMDPSILGE